MQHLRTAYQPQTPRMLVICFLVGLYLGWLLRDSWEPREMVVHPEQPIREFSPLGVTTTTTNDGYPPVYYQADGT